MSFLYRHVKLRLAVQSVLVRVGLSQIGLNLGERESETTQCRDLMEQQSIETRAEKTNCGCLANQFAI